MKKFDEKNIRNDVRCVCDQTFWAILQGHSELMREQCVKLCAISHILFTLGYDALGCYAHGALCELFDIGYHADYRYLRISRRGIVRLRVPRRDSRP